MEQKKYSYEIEKLDSGFLITKDEKIKIGITTLENLEAQITKSLSENANVRSSLYYLSNTKIKINISVEVIP